MWKFIVRRIIIMFPQLVLLSMIVFILAQLMPGDVTSSLAMDPNVSPEQQEQIREDLGLNEPWHTQYLNWVGSVVQGDFGHSFTHSVPVSDLIWHRMVNSIWLGVAALIFVYMLALPLGLISGRWNDTIADRLITGYTYIGFAAPLFIFALVMLFIFGFQLGWFPTGGSVDPGLTGWDFFTSKVYHLLLPALSLALIGTVTTVQYLRSEVIETKQKEFISTARAKGVPEPKVYTNHIFRNSLLPIAAVFGYEVTTLIGGSIFVEQIFSYPGMGQLFLESIQVRDFPVVTAIVMLFGVAAILGALLSDIIMSIVDPRIRIK
ncbi:peptide/nickel transport system permease protein/peptide/nickel transport system permease protein [Salsuginibacillus halophilus]|uniref:Peptide/nickel transport system permease protein/peptide/nickel transport system permease protein n=1 Tax=Salsuginibacillus halophilus TaxID=517424 RepID=A0A2P8HI34_9BACI|nr:oligopeptide ABC transporter permease [Salsuginibacillus halophilus]PSL45884.1 peptide/nickel transport system permease protein/peptide/nickel transport system permease protein [Salsuginibacillus halophilus]